MSGKEEGPASSKKRYIPDIDNDTVEKYARGSVSFSVKGVKHKALRRTLNEEKAKMKESAAKTAVTEVLLPSEPGFIETDSNQKVYRLKQRDVMPHIDMNSAKNAFEFQLQNFGPYNIDYTRNGRYMLLGGKKGHVAIFDCMRMKLGMELQLQEDLYDIQYLHNETMFACAQKKYTYIYDYKGVEIHCLKNHERPYRLDFLPYHFLLVTAGHSGYIKWQDISTGTSISAHQTGHGPCRALRHNKQNGVSHVGHGNGVVSLWSPASGKPLVSMFCHKAPVADLAIDREGRYMATSGFDKLMKVWDLRTFKLLHAYHVDQPAMSMDISDTGLLSMAIGRSAQILKDAFTKPTDVTYLKHELRAPNASLSSGGGVTAAVNTLASSVSAQCVRFRPLEDVLCIGHSHGISTIITPGAGQANFDAFENDPFMNPSQRKEKEVQNLLNKLNYDLIGLDPSFVARVDKDNKQLQIERKELFTAANEKDPKNKKEKHKMRGKNKISAKLRRKQKNVVDEQSVKLKEKLLQDKQTREDLQNKKSGKGGVSSENSFDPLGRFAKKTT